MSEQRKELEETARVLRGRLRELERRRVGEIERPMHEVAVKAVRASLTQVGRKLLRLAI